MQLAADCALAFTAPDGRALPREPPREIIEDAVLFVRERAADQGLELGAETNLPEWDGNVVDYQGGIQRKGYYSYPGFGCQGLGLVCHEWVLGVRLAHARRLLAGDAGRITEVAHASGFTSLAHSSVAFRAVSEQAR